MGSVLQWFDGFAPKNMPEWQGVITQSLRDSRVVRGCSDAIQWVVGSGQGGTVPMQGNKVSLEQPAPKLNACFLFEEKGLVSNSTIKGKLTHMVLGFEKSCRNTNVSVRQIYFLTCRAKIF